MVAEKININIVQTPRQLWFNSVESQVQLLPLVNAHKQSQQSTW